jgi:DNA repair protein RadC
MKPIRDMPEKHRPREMLKEKGAGALTDRDLIAAIIGRGVKGRDVFSVAADIRRVIKAKEGRITFSDFDGITGIGTTKACQLVAAFELARRYPVMDPNHRIKITKPDDILPHVVDLILKKQEHFICFTLNGAGELIEKRTLTVGLLNHSPVHPREVFADAITDRAASVVLVHNHPSGSPEPSAPDIEITRQLAEAGTLLGITVLDHIIVAARGHVSLKERGIL